MISRVKIKNLMQLKRNIEELKAQGKKVTLCLGCFDLLHPGHIYQFEFAKSLGDVLIVSVTGDKYVRKDPHRPFFNENARAEIIASIGCVDAVIINNFGEAKELLAELKPHFYVKGKEYQNPLTPQYPELMEEKAIVEANGGQLIFSEMIFDGLSGKYSSTNFVDKVINSIKETNNGI